MLSRNEKIAWKESDERSYTMDLQEFTKFEDISSTRMGISLSKGQFNIKHSKDSLHFSILFAHLSSPVCRASRQGRYIEN